MIDPLEGLDINPQDLRIDTYSNPASPFGYPYIRITHKPTGIVIDWNEDESPQKVRRKAFELLAEEIKKRANTNPV